MLINNGIHHSIDKVIISLEMENDNVQIIYQRCSRLFQQDLKGIIDQALYRYSKKIAYSNVIDSITVDLGILPIAHFEYEFKKSFRTQLERAFTQLSPLNNKIITVTDENIIAMDAMASALLENSEKGVSPFAINLDVIESYLSNGNWPARALLITPATQPNWETVLFEQMRNSPENLPKLAAHCLKAQNLHRIVNVFSFSLLGKIVALLQQAVQKDARKVAIQQLIEPTVRAAPSMEAVMQLKINMVASALHYLSRYADNAIPMVDNTLILLWQKALSQSQEALALLVSLFTADTLNVVQLTPWLAALWQHSTVKKALQKQLSPTLFAAINVSSLTTERHDNLVKNNADSEAGGLRYPSLSPLEHAKKALAKQWAPTSAEINEPIVVSNAGILLLWPLYSSLFTFLNLLKDKKFLDLQAQVNGVYLLDYLIWGEQQTPEWRMALNKLLCGLPLEIEINEYPMPQEQQKDAISWLENITKQLPYGKKLSLIDVREFFLQRPGKLFLQDNMMQIEIEAEIFDFLLADWPWPLDTAILPWLEQPITIDWKNSNL